MIPIPFTIQMTEDSPTLDRLALALAFEFAAADPLPVYEALDVLAAELEGIHRRPPEEQCRACAAVLARAPWRLRGARSFEPQTLLVDRVLGSGEGHALVLALIYAEVGRRAGVPLAPVGAGDRFFVAHAETDPSLVLDPCAGGRLLSADEVPDSLVWLCAHTAGFALLNCLREAYSLSGDVVRALHAVDLGLALPIAGAPRLELEREARRLSARLN